MRRPKLLIAAAQYVARNKRFRKRSLKAIMAEEQGWEDLRKSKDYGYKVQKHIMILGEYIAARQQ